MKTMAQIGLVAILAVALVAAVGCSEKTPAPKSPAKEPVQTMPAPKEAAAPVASADIAQKLCPVTGDPIDPSIYVDYNGRRIYFCCALCPADFKKDPEKYIKIVDEQLKSPPAMGATKGTMGMAPAAPAVSEQVAYYTCTIHPEVKSDKPGKCPKCGMDLVAVAQK